MTPCELVYIVRCPRDAAEGAVSRGLNWWVVSSSLSGPVDNSFRALSGNLKFTVRGQKFNAESLSWVVGRRWL